MASLKKRSFLFGAAYYCIISLAIILFLSPLFRILGFEYSGLIALFASIHLLYYSSNFAAERKTEAVWNIVKRLWLQILFFSSIPLVVSLISVFFIPNCSLWDGILFYIEIVYPTALIAMICGIRFGIILRSKTKTNIYLAIFWIATFIFSLLPGYLTAKIYTYGWQYGYFPGFVWDEAMELSNGYWVARMIQIILIFLWIIYDIDKRKREHYTFADAIKLLVNWQLWIAIVFSSFLGVIGYNYFSGKEIENYLSARISFSTAIIHFKVGTLSEDEISLIKFNTKRYIREIDSIYGIKSLSNINIYIFPSTDDLYQFVGTREASISKPWKHSIYIAKQNLHSLKHEMAHIILAEYGSFPFDISWSTGLTEGAAVAIEDDYDGIRSVDEYSTRMLQMKLIDGVEQVMQPSGFLASAPSQSYVLAGSFTKYLIQTYGAQKFLRVYQERDFDAVYNKPLVILDKEWKKLLLAEYASPMDHYDSLRTMYYFKRTSILRQPCVRRIGKLLKYADDAYKNKEFKIADSMYSLIIAESGRLSAIRGRVLSQLHLNNPNAALAILDTTASANEINNLSALRMLRGDVIALATGDLLNASGEWEEAMKLELGENYFLGAYMRKNFLGNTNSIEGIQKILRDIYGLEKIKDMSELIFSIIPADDDPQFYKARLFLDLSYIEKTSGIKAANKIWRNDFYRSKRLSEDVTMPSEILFDKLMAKRYSHYEEIFKDIR